ncbi:hypothetical protein GE061_006737 [Apolygus lucorum]|uniref:CNNM transmembrane domain-containing protein n=1 Tax=Apolygus lucorum TaxID=248454 RepID=A0A6A4J7D1_APOLU|nr:hypothetical protein GE061_006737 [Apolygus lucorum]
MEAAKMFFTIACLFKVTQGGELTAFRITAYHSIWTYSFNDEMIPEFIEGSVVGFRMVGHLKNVTKVAMTASTSDCTVLQESTISDISRKSEEEVTTSITMPNLLQKTQILYFCFKVAENTWTHQGSEDWAYVIVEQRLLSLPLIIIIIIICVILSGLLNGLVLGLMSLDITELKVIANAGGEKEKKHGKAILSVRKRGNFLLISLVVGATSLNSTVTVLIDSFVSEWMTVVIVTLTIVLFCEIIPNSIVSRFALTIGAKTIYLTWLVMILTSPVSYPLGRLLDKLLGEDIPNLTRERLKELVKITADVSALKKTEIDMISGALEMSAKKVEDIMTLLEDVYSIALETLLDYESIREIISSGYSRIPIYEGEKSNIIKIMYVRDLALVDPEDKTPLALFSKLMADQEIVYVDEGTTIDGVFNIFKEGVHGHMAFVVKNRKDQEGPPQVTGLLTLEDIIEEIVQVEIVDEYDVIVDNRSKRKRQRYRMISDYMSVFADSFESKNILISPNLRIAALNFLASELKEFAPEVISPNVLQRLLRQGVIVHLPKKKPKSVNPLIFSQGQAREGFVMVLEGRAQIVIGPDNLRCECGPFSYFGLGILTDSDDTIVYGFAVEAIAEVRYLKIPRELYQAAIEATHIEKGLPGNVPNSYRGLLADEDEIRDLGDTSRMTQYYAESRASPKSGKEDSKTVAWAQSVGESSKRNSLTSKSQSPARKPPEEQDPKHALYPRKKDQSPKSDAQPEQKPPPKPSTSKNPEDTNSKQSSKPDISNQQAEESPKTKEPSESSRKSPSSKSLESKENPKNTEEDSEKK